MDYLTNLPFQNQAADSNIPTVFEIVSSNEIDELIPSSIRYLLVNYWIQNRPSFLSININNYFEEWLNVFFKGSIEIYFLNKHNSTFVDKYYGIQRYNGKNTTLLNAYNNAIRTSTTTKEIPLWAHHWPKGLQLTRLQKIIILIQKIIIPYLTIKLDRIYNKLLINFNPSIQNNDKITKFKNLIKFYFKNWYLTIKKTINLLDLFVMLSFLTRKKSHFTLLDYIFDIEYIRCQAPLEETLQKNIVVNNNRPQRQNYYRTMYQLKQYFSKIKNISSICGSQLLPSFIFFLRVYQWWINENISYKLNQKLKGLDKSFVKPSTSISINKEKENNDSNSIYSKGCPICHQQIQNPCVIETGYIMCYPCAKTYICQNEGRCPITQKKLLGCSFDKQSSEWKINSGIRRLMI